MKIRKIQGDWEARTDTPINSDGTRILRLSTSKTNSGGKISTTARTWTITDGGESTVFGIAGGGGDFSVSITTVPCKRVTEKAIRDAHQAALPYLDSLLLQCGS